MRALPESAGATSLRNPLSSSLSTDVAFVSVVGLIASTKFSEAMLCPAMLSCVVSVEAFGSELVSGTAAGDGVIGVVAADVADSARPIGSACIGCRAGEYVVWCPTLVPSESGGKDLVTASVDVDAVCVVCVTVRVGPANVG